MTKSPWVVKIQQALTELASQYDPSAPESIFVFHPLYRVGVSEKSFENIEKVFGKSFLRRFRHYSGNLKKLDWVNYAGRRFVARIPSDAIIFFRDDKEGMIIASHEKQFVLKMFFEESHIALLDEEVATLRSFAQTSFAPYAARLLGDGKTSNGGRWVATSFCSNTQALTGMPNHEKYLLRYFSRIVMPGMTEFYKSFDPKVISINGWIQEAHQRIESHPSRAKLEKLLKKISALALKFPAYEVVESRIHHDLHAGNILIDDNETIIIDWEGQVRGLVLVDVFDFIRRYLHGNLIDSFVFGLFMRGIWARPTTLVNDALLYYRNWMLVNYNIELPVKSARLSLMIYAVERALIIYELRHLDRFKDKRGIESYILKAIQ